MNRQCTQDTRSQKNDIDGMRLQLVNGAQRKLRIVTQRTIFADNGSFVASRQVSDASQVTRKFGTIACNLAIAAIVVTTGGCAHFAT